MVALRRAYDPRVLRTTGQVKLAAMNKLLSFLKTALFRGFLAILPLLLLYMLVAEMLEAATGLAAPVVHLVLGDTLEKGESPELVAVALVVALSLLLGVLACTQWARAAGVWLERNTVMRIGLYRTLRAFGTSFAGSRQDGTLSAALLRHADGSREFVYVVEQHADSTCTVMLPRTPTPMVGELRIVPQDWLQPLDASVADVSRVITQWGVGGGELLPGAATGPGPKRKL